MTLNSAPGSINPAVKTDTTVSVGSDHNPSTSGQTVTITATVSPESGTGTPTGSVQFSIDGNPAGGPVALVGGQATLVTSSLGTGHHLISVTYGGDATFAMSTSADFDQSVLSGPATHFALALNPNSSMTAGNSVSVVVVALDANNGLATGYSGTVHLSTSDAQGVVSADAPLMPGLGMGFFSATLKTAGLQTITATDAAHPSMTGQASITVTAAAAAALAFGVQPSDAPALAPISPSITVRVVDAYGNLTSSTASVGLAVTGAAATLSGTATQSAAAGTASFGGLSIAKAGSYTLDATSAGLTGATSASFTISALGQSIDFTAPAGKTYGDAPFTIGATATSGLPVAFTGLSNTICTVSGTTVTIVAAGSCQIRAEQGGDATYAPAAPVSTSFQIGMAPLAVNTDDVTITYGDPTPTIDTYYGPFVNGENASVLGGTLVWTYAGTGATAYGPSSVAPVNAGTYSLTPSGLTSSNYAITFQPAAYTIAKANQSPLSITGPTSGSLNQQLPITTTGGSGTGSLSFSAGASTACAIVGSQVKITASSGTCSLTATKAADGNYNLATSAPFSVSITVTVSLAVTSVVPNSVGRGATSWPVVVNGSGFGAGAALSASGTGVSFASVTVLNANQISANVTVTTGASLTARNVTVTMPGPVSATCTSCLTVAAAPTISGVSPSSRGQGAVSQNLTVSGTGFVAGTWTASSVFFSGTGITVNSVTRNSATSLTVNVSISGTAATTSRSITVINANGGRATRSSAFTVASAPSISSLSPSSRGQGATNQSITINGSNFGSGTWNASSVLFSGTGITVNSVTRNSSTRLTVNISIASTATTGGRDVTVVNPNGGRATRTNGFTVNAGPTLTSVSPSSAARGHSGIVLIVNGSNLQSGGTISISGSGITITSATRLSSTQIRIVVTISSTAAVGGRTITFRNADSGTAVLTGGLIVTT